MAYPIEDETENARTLTKLRGELEKKESVIQSWLNLYFSNESLHSKWDTYSESHPLYSNYLEERKEEELDELADLLKNERIKTSKGEKLDEEIESRIGIVFEGLLEIIEESKIRKLNS